MTFKAAREYKEEVVAIQKGYESKWETCQVFKLSLDKIIYGV